MRFLFLFSGAPYADSGPREALDMALATAAFDQRVTLVFHGEGILQLVKAQQPAGSHKKSHIGAINALPLYDVAAVHYLEEDLQTLGIGREALVGHAAPLDARRLQTLIADADRVQSF